MIASHLFSVWLCYCCSLPIFGVGIHPRYRCVCECTTPYGAERSDLGELQLRALAPDHSGHDRNVTWRSSAAHSQ